MKGWIIDDGKRPRVFVGTLTEAREVASDLHQDMDWKGYVDILGPFPVTRLKKRKRR
jgi:hypothetical protein